MRHLREILVCVAILLVASPLGFAYERWMANGEPLVRGPYVSFEVDPSVVAGLQNIDKAVIITPESDPLGALRASVATWSSIPTSSVLMNVFVTPATANSEDRHNVFAFEDTPENRSVIGDAIAVTVVMFTTPDNVIFDSDILFSPLMTFATTPTEGAFDLESTATHELGHTITSGHSALASATMFWAGNPVDTFPRVLSTDDVAFASDLFPKNVLTVGGIQGKVATAAGVALSRALVVAVDTTRGAVVSVSPLHDGSYSLGGLQPGNYYVFAEPIAPWLTADLGNDPFLTPDWQATFHQNGGAPQAVTVTGGRIAQADIVVPQGQSQAAIDFATMGTAAPLDQLSMTLPSGTSSEVAFWGRGLSPDLGAADVWILGPGISVRPGSVQVFPATHVMTFDVMTMVLDVAGRSDWAEAAIAVRSRGAIAVYSGVRMTPTAPAFVPLGVANGAGFAPPGVAPGELVSIFGAALGPAAPVTGVLDAGGRLGTSLGGVTVTFGGVAAPLFYVSSGQINAQVPFEVASHASTRVRVQVQGASSEAIVPVVVASPAIFGSAGYPAIANPDGSAQDRGNPASPGAVIVAYGTGQGAIAPALATGRVASASPASLIADVSATIDGVPAQVRFAGMAAGLVGFMQLNIQIPFGTSGGPVPLVVTIDGISSVKSTNVFVRPSSPTR